MPSKPETLPCPPHLHSLQCRTNRLFFYVFFHIYQSLFTIQYCSSSSDDVVNEYSPLVFFLMFAAIDLAVVGDKMERWNLLTSPCSIIFNVPVKSAFIRIPLITSYFFNFVFLALNIIVVRRHLLLTLIFHILFEVEDYAL